MGKQVKVVVSTPTNYRPGMDNSGTGVPGTPAGAAPTKAPSQTIIQTGKGPVPKGAEGHPDPGGLAPQPPSNGSTAPIENGPSVDYDNQQGSRIPGDIATAQHRIIVGEQDQQLQDKAGA